MREHIDLACLGIHAQDGMTRIVRDEHHPVAVKADAVAERPGGHFEEDFAFAVRSHASDGRLAGEADGIDGAVAVASGALDFGRETVPLSQWRRGLSRQYLSHNEQEHDVSEYLAHPPSECPF